MREAKSKKPKGVIAPSKSTTPRTDAPAPDEIAYEDSWYRSLKALAERRPVNSEKETEGSED